MVFFSGGEPQAEATNGRTGVIRYGKMGFARMKHHQGSWLPGVAKLLLLWNNKCPYN